MKLKAEQIIKAMERCRDEFTCAGCPYEPLVNCHRELWKDALALIRELTEKTNSLQTAYNELYETTTEEIKRLTEKSERLRERNITLEQKLMLLGIDDVYVFKAKVEGE